MEKSSGIYQTKTIVRRIIDVSDKGISAEVDFAGEITGSGRLAGMGAKFEGTDFYVWKPAPATAQLITGTAQSELAFRSSEIVLFKAVGLGNQTSYSPPMTLSVVSLLSFVEPPESFSWMRITPVIWEAVVDLESQTSTGTAWEWVSPRSTT